MVAIGQSVGETKLIEGLALFASFTSPSSERPLYACVLPEDGIFGSLDFGESTVALDLCSLFAALPPLVLASSSIVSIFIGQYFPSNLETIF